MPVRWTSYNLNIILIKEGNTAVDDFNFTASRDGEIICQRLVKRDIKKTECQIQDIEYKSNVAMLNFFFEMTNSMNHTSVKILANDNVLAKKNLNGKYNGELTCNIDWPSMIKDNTLNINVICTN